MSRYKVSELDPELTTWSKKGKLYHGESLKCGGKGINNSKQFYVEVLNYLVDKENVNIKQVLNDSDCKVTAEKPNWEPIKGTKLCVYTNISNVKKYKNMQKCFEELQKTGVDISKYEFELDIDNNGTDGENEMAADNKKGVDDIINNALQNNKQVIFTGAPGTGKTWSVREYVNKRCSSNDKKQYKFVQFHPSYDYSDFVEGLRPVVIRGKDEPTFVRMDGVFKEFCRHIVEENDENKNYYFIVDEINRADLAKVFGELMFGLEESYREKGNLIQTQYKNLVTYKIIDEEYVKENNSLANEDIGKAIPIENDVFKEGFYIPKNLYFIGTMNDIDRSVDSMDFALRRRFQWIEIKANEIMASSLHNILGKSDGDKNSDAYKRIDRLAEKIKSMNEIISSSEYRFGLSGAYHIGPAYFKKLDVTSDDNLKNSLQSIFETNIVSILKEYTRGRKSEDVDDWIEKSRKALLGDK